MVFILPFTHRIVRKWSPFERIGHRRGLEVGYSHSGPSIVVAVNVGSEFECREDSGGQCNRRHSVPSSHRLHWWPVNFDRLVCGETFGNCVHWPVPVPSASVQTPASQSTWLAPHLNRNCSPIHWCVGENFQLLRIRWVEQSSPIVWWVPRNDSWPVKAVLGPHLG